MSERKLANEADYNLRLRHADFADYFAVWADESARVRDAVACECDVRYGTATAMTLDLFPAPSPRSPIFFFIHGGYWRAMDKSDFSYPAEPFVAAGAAFVSINYTLAPAVTIADIVAQTQTAIAWTVANAGRLNGDPDRLFVSGHSAGGHLTGMMLCTDWRARGLAPDVIKGAVPISGIFDLAPIIETSINDDARLNAESAREASPLHQLPARVGTPIIAAVGAEETPGFLDQNRRFAEAWGAAGGPVEVMEVPGLHHFNVVNELGLADAPLTQATLRLMGL